MKKTLQNSGPVSGIGHYLRDNAGAVAIAFALVIPVVVGSAGMAVDLSMAHMVKQRLSHAIDAAALAAAASGGSESDMNAKVNQFFHQNYPENKIGATYNLTVSIEGDDIHVTAKADYDTTFARMLGIDELTVSSSTRVTREILGLEVAMVLDVTGSMSTNNNIGALKTASKNFLDILCRDETCSSLVKIGIVPFSAAVNVGPYGLGKNPNGTTYDTPFVNNPYNTSFNQSQNSKWWGCVLARTSPQDTQNGDTGWKWDMYRNPYNSNKNSGCNKSYILPLTSTYGTIEAKIDSLYASGNTLSNLGMVWGYRVLSPEAPFREGALWTDKTVKKVALLMTDGDNNIGGGSSSYSGYGPWTNLRLTDHDLDVKLAQTCENMKADGITVYTITFTSGINETTKGYFRNCASDENKYYDAPGQDDLVDAFVAISRELSNIHIKE
ncbi:MAG TPA: pilus assembly protein [Alphaproteobacteria bacterium]|nr:pilus assembly protein [Alphaproteobacteria bacterium]HNS44023.1 pilus assembly protein [Alphaproteobacteria bacterium]